MQTALSILIAVLLLGNSAQAEKTSTACGFALATILNLTASESINLKGKTEDCDATIKLLADRSSIGDQAVSITFSGIEGATVSSEAEKTPDTYQEGSCEVGGGIFTSVRIIHLRQGWLGQHKQKFTLEMKDGHISAIDSQYYSGGPFTDSHSFVRKCKY